MNTWTRMLAPLRGGGIRRRLLIWGLSLFGIALSTIVAIGYSYMVWQIHQDAAAMQSEIAELTSERIRNFVRRKIDRFADNASALSLYQLGDKEQKVLLGLLVKNDTSFTHASIIDANGMEVIKVSDRKVYFPADLTDQSKSASFIKALKGENFISSVHTSSQAQPYVTISIPLWGIAQSVAGVVSAEADLSFLWDALNKIQFGAAGYAYLVDGQGNLIAHKDPRQLLKRLNLRNVDGVKKFLRNPSLADDTPAREGIGITGDPVLVTYAPVPELGWAVILEEPIDAALANVDLLRRSALLFLMTSLIIGAAIIAWASQKITRPIQVLRQDVATIGAGNLEHRSDIATGDEIEELAREFNHMTVALQNSYATLEEKVDQRTKEIAALYSVTTAVNQSLALKDIFNAIIPKTKEIFQFETIRVFLLNNQGTQLELQASHALDLEHTTQIRALKRGEGVIGHVVETGEAMVFENLQSDPRYAELSTTKATLNAKLGFLAVFPIKTQTHIFGTILFGAQAPRTLSPEQTRLLTSMSEHLAVAVEKAELYRESEERAQQLSTINKELDQANQAKSEFISAMSHELRTPLNVIMGNAELTSDGFWGAVNDDQKKSMEKIRHHSRFLLKLVNDVLALSRLDAKKMSLELSTVDIEDVVSNVQSHVEQLNRTKGLEVNWDIDHDLPEIFTDETKLEEILQNLIGNAFKFTPHGQINLRVKNRPEQRCVEFCVADSGIGIEPRDMERIFKAFEQIREAHTGDFNGVGLGLSIVKNYLDLMNGDIRVESRPGEGSTFIFTVPHSIPVPS